MFLDNYLFDIRRKSLFFIEEHYPALPLIVALTYKCDMGCFYCYAKGLDTTYKEEMYIDNFIELIKWIKKQQICKIMFVGGEPTQHSRFSEIAKLCTKNNLVCYMATNCAYSENINDVIAKNIKVLFVNCSTGYAATKKSDLLNKLRFLSRYGTKLILKVNISTANFGEIDWIRDAAKELKARIRIGIINSTVVKDGPAGIEKIRSFIFYIEGFARQCIRDKVYIYLARPLPRCFFNGDEWRRLRGSILIKSKCFIGYRGNYASRVVVNPDLSVFGCFNNLKRAESILNFSSINQLSIFYKDIFQDKIKKCFLVNSKKCNNLIKFVCSGGCFANVI
ncbi:MAG: radical SAM protein [Candidatus Omnitrophota bacterium]